MVNMASIEVPKELADKLYEIIETAKATGKRCRRLFYSGN